MTLDEIIKELTTYDLSNHFNNIKHFQAINELIELYKNQDTEINELKKQRDYYKKMYAEFNNAFIRKENNNG